MFESIYSASVTAAEFFLMAGASLVAGVVFAWILSFRVRATKRFFLVNTLLPFVVATVVTFVNGNIGAGIAVGGAFTLIRFRSAPGSADEIASVLIAMGSGIAFGTGYVGYGVVILIGLSLIYFLLSLLPIFEHGGPQELLLRITVPESLEYTGMFDDIFRLYLEEVQNVGVKTTGFGSMFRLSYKIRMKDPTAQKALIDALRTRNGNLEINIVPFVDEQVQL